MARRALAGLAALAGITAACGSLLDRPDTGRQAGDPGRGLKPGTSVAYAFSTQPDQAAVMQRAAAAFAQRYPGVTAEFINTQGQNHEQKVTTAIAAGTPIDVFTLNPNQTVDFANSAMVRAVDDLVRRDRYDTSDFFEKCLGQYNWKGKLYALPRGFGNQDIYYSTRLWDSAGSKRPPYDWNAKDWAVEEFLDAATRLARLTTPAGERVWGWNQGTGLRQWAPWVWIFGGDILDNSGTQCILDQQAAVDGLQFLQDLVHRHRVMPPPSTRLSTIPAMGSGQLGMAMDIPAALGRYRQQEGLAFDVAPMPRKATRLTSGGGIAWHMASNTPHVNEAWAVQQWVASKEVQTWECDVGGTAPPRKSVIKLPCYVDRTQQPKGIDVFVQAPDFVHVDPQAVGWNEAEQVISTGFASLWDGSRTARQIVQDIVPQVNRILKANAR